MLIITSFPLAKLHVIIQKSKIFQILKKNDSKFKIPYPIKLVKGGIKIIFTNARCDYCGDITYMDKISSIPPLSQVKLR